MHLQDQKEREEREQHHGRKRAAHRQEDPSNGAHPDEEPEPGRTIHQAEDERQETQDSKEQEGEQRACSSPRFLAGWMGPHEPGVAGRKNEESQQSPNETPEGTRLTE